MTLDEFRRLHGVANAVNTQGRKIVDGFETDMSFNRIFGGGD